MMRSFIGLESSQQLFSKVCVCVLFVFGFYCRVFQKWVPWFENSKGVQQSIESIRSITQGMGVVLCKDFWNNDWGKLMCCISVFCLSNRAMVLRKSNCVICVVWGIYNIVCKLELELQWKPNAIQDLCGSEDFEKRGQWAQETEIKVI
jgi:hypothetical protein